MNIQTIRKGFTLLEVLITLLIISLFTLVGLPNWQQNNAQVILNKEQHRLYLFLRQLQARVENTNDIWYLILNRNIERQSWCITAQLKSDMSCDCFNPTFCPEELVARFYYPLIPDKTMISAKWYYPTKLISFNGARNSADSGCLVLQAERHRTLFSFSNLGRVRLRKDQTASTCSSGEGE